MVHTHVRINTHMHAEVLEAVLSYEGIRPQFVYPSEPQFSPL